MSVSQTFPSRRLAPLSIVVHTSTPTDSTTTPTTNMTPPSQATAVLSPLTTPYHHRLVVLLSLLVGLVLLSDLCASDGIVISSANAAAIPFSVTQGYTYSIGDQIYSTTTLNVDAMTNDASTVGNGTAVFEAHSTLFSAGLVITCTAATTWTHNNTNLLVRIINGYTTPGVIPSAGTLISISGSLRLGSKIEIQGGIYTFKTNFVSASVSLYDDSILNISSTTLVLNDTNYLSSTYSPTIFQFSGTANITDGSVVSFSGNNITFERIQVGGYLYLEIITTYQLSVMNGGNMLIQGNSVTIMDCAFSGIPYVRFMYSGYGYLFLKDLGSALKVSKNSFKLVRTTFTSILNVDFTYWTNMNEVSISDGSSLLVEDNFVVYDTVQVGSACYFTGLFIAMGSGSTSPIISIRNSSTMSISNLLVLVRNCTFQSSTSWLVKGLYLEATNTSVSSGSSVEVKGVFFKVVDSTFVGSWSHTISFFKGTTIITDRSSIQVDNITAVAVSSSINSWTTYQLYLQIANTLTVSDSSSISATNGKFRLKRSNITTQYYISHFYMYNMIVVVQRGSIFNVSGNSMWADDSIVGSLSQYFVYVVSTPAADFTDGSTLVVSGNNYDYRTLVIDGALKFQAFNWRFPNLINKSHSITSGNSYVVVDTTISADMTSILWSATTAIVVIDEGSSVRIENNFRNFSNVEGVKLTVYCWYSSGSSTISVLSGSTMSVVENTNIASNLQFSGAVVVSVFYARVGMRVRSESRVVVSKNSAVGWLNTAVDMVIIAGSSLVLEALSDNTSSLLIADNSISPTGTMLTVTVSMPIGSTSTCGNYVNDTHCEFTMPYGSSSSCIGISSSTSLVVQDCGVVVVKTETLTQSLESSSVSSTHTATPTATQRGASQTLSHVPSHTVSTTQKTTTLPNDPHTKTNTLAPTATTTYQPPLPSSTITATPHSETPSHASPSSSLSPPSSSHSKDDTLTTTPSPSRSVDAKTPSHTPTSTNIISSSSSASVPLIPPCNLSCSDILDVSIITTTSTSTTSSKNVVFDPSKYAPQNGSPAIGCAKVKIPFKYTNEGRYVRLAVFFRTDVTAVNTTFEPPLAYSSSSSLIASPRSDIRSHLALPGGGGGGTGSNITMGVVVIEVSRIDSEPLESIDDAKVDLHPDMFLCRPTSSITNNNVNRRGLPWVNLQLQPPPSSLSDGEKIIIASISAASPDLQTVAAMSLLRCAPGSSSNAESEASIRALVPVALSATCTGAIEGALLTIILVGCISVIVTGVFSRVKGIPWIEAASTTRCPSVLLAVIAFLQMGFVVCGARLVTQPSSGAWDVTLGVIGIGVGGLLPLGFILLAWTVVSRRCYQLGPRLPQLLPPTTNITQTPSSTTTSMVARIRYIFLPRYELDGAAIPVSKAFSIIVGRTRLPSCVWACLPVIQPMLMFAVVFVDGDGCSVSLIIVGVLTLLICFVHLWFQPHRVLVSNYLQSLATALNACILFVAAPLATNPLNPTALTANSGIAMLQTGLSLVRIIHSCIAILYMRKYGKEVFQWVEPENGRSKTTTAIPSVVVADTTLLLPEPVFEVKGVCSSSTTYKRSEPTQPPPPLAAPLLQQQIPAPKAHHPVVVADVGAEQGTSSKSKSRNNLRVIHTVDSQHEEVKDKNVEPPQPQQFNGGGFRLGVLGRLGGGGAVRHQNFNDTIISSVINNHRGYIPMERPYTLLWQEEDDDDDDLHINGGNDDDTEELRSIGEEDHRVHNHHEQPSMESDDLDDLLSEVVSSSSSSSASSSLESLALDDSPTRSAAAPSSSSFPSHHDDALLASRKTLAHQQHPPRYREKRHSVDEELEL